MPLHMIRGIDEIVHGQDLDGYSVREADHDDWISQTEIGRALRHTGIGSCYVYVRDADAPHAELIAKGALVQEEPVSREWGPREIHVLGPEGNRLTFGQPFE